MIKFSLLYANIKENLLMTSLSKMVKEITKIFKKNAEKLAVNSKFKQRDSKLTPEAFLITFVIGQLINPESTLEDICSLLLKHYQISITKQGLEQRFNEPCAEFVKLIFNNLLNCFAENNLKMPDILKKFTKVELLDSSVVSLPEVLSNAFPGFGGAASKAALRIQTLFNWTNNQISNIDLTAATKNDQGYKGHIAHIQKNTLLLQDLGYFDLNSFSEIVKKEAYFISRFKSNISTYQYESTDNLSYAEFALIDYLKNNEDKDWVSFHARIGANNLLPVRFIARPVPNEVYQDRLRKARKEKKQKKIKQSTTYLYRWDIYITNIPSDMISDKDIFMIYKLRWQIELLFKLSKSQAGIDKIAGRKQPRVI